jgi:hypothetical protein
MITIKQQQKGAELMKDLVENAWKSAAFKDQLVKNPTSTIEEFTNKKFTMPENKRLVVEDQTNSSIIFLNIPPKPNYTEMELTDEQLDIVAGGEIMCVAAWGVVGVLCLAGGIGVGMALR